MPLAQNVPTERKQYDFRTTHETSRRNGLRVDKL